MYIYIRIKLFLMKNKQHHKKKYSWNKTIIQYILINPPKKKPIILDKNTPPLKEKKNII